MNHQLFEEWLLSDEPLTGEQERALGAHLKTCDSCAAIGSAWEQVRTDFYSAEMVEPSPGFANRWQARWASHQGHLERRQAWALLALNWTIAAALFVLVVWQVLPTLPSLPELFVRWVERLTVFVTYVRVASGVLGFLARTMLDVIPSNGWVSILASAGALVALWVATIKKYALSQGVA